MRRILKKAEILAEQLGIGSPELGIVGIFIGFFFIWYYFGTPASNGPDNNHNPF